MKTYTTVEDMYAVVESFEKATISRDDWKHAEHIIVGLYYLSRYDMETALVKMREGIFNLLRAFEVDLTKEMPYHETITVFWMQTVDEFRRSKNGASMVEIVNELIEKFDKDYPLKFYSRELLFSDAARSKFVEPDLKLKL